MFVFHSCFLTNFVVVKLINLSNFLIEWQVENFVFWTPPLHKFYYVSQFLLLKIGSLHIILMWRYVCYLSPYQISHPCVSGYLNKAENKQNFPCGRHFLISPSKTLLPQQTYTIFSKVYEGTSFRDPNVRGASITFATKVRAFSPLLLLLLLLTSSLVTGLFFLVLLLNQRWSSPLRLQASHCSISVLCVMFQV
jgi:hypothetical protein